MEPADFPKAFDAFLVRYSDNTRRPGRSGIPGPLIPSYHIPMPVLRSVEHAVRKKTASIPETGLALADALWLDPHLEFKSLAISALANLPEGFATQSYARVRSWTQTIEEEKLLEALLKQVFIRVYFSAPEAGYAQLQNWLDAQESDTRELGIKTLIFLVQEEKFQNIPQVFQILHSLLDEITPDNRLLLRDLVRELAQKTPKETVFFLRQSWIISQKPEAAWLIRQSLSALKPDDQQSLKEVLAS